MSAARDAVGESRFPDHLRARHGGNDAVEAAVMMRLMVSASEESLEHWRGLSAFQINVIRGGNSLENLLEANGSMVPIDAALLDLDGTDSRQRSMSIPYLKNRGICTVVVTSDSAGPLETYLEEGADGVVSRTSRVEDIACVLWSVYRQCALRRDLQQQIEVVRRKLEHQKLIAHAKGIIIEQLGISEPEALRRLRRESRNHRRPMHELAQALIAVRPLVTAEATGEIGRS